jgi:bifunctional enzyme CysN/CysC
MGDYLRIIVAGEVDAGKSTLIGRFLYEMNSISEAKIREIESVSQRSGGDFEFTYLLDSFEEERRNQLTIDTTQAFCRTEKGKKFIFIDVPGHQELIKNMLCGSSYADIAILVVDIQKSIEEQTRRHVFILKFLGIDQIIVVLNKMDLADFSELIFKKVREEISGFFRKIQLRPKYTIPISAKQGENLIKISKKISWYKGLSLIKALNTCFKKEMEGAFRLPIQDIYNFDDKEKIAVGSIISGKIKKGEKVNILPLNKICQVRAIRLFNKIKPVVKVPESIGLILDDMQGVCRGHVICKPRFPIVNTEILSRIFCICPVHLREKLRFQCSTQEIGAWISEINGVWDTANITPIKKDNLLPVNSIADVLITTENPVVVEKFIGINRLGRFVLRGNNKDIHAIGVVS